MPRSGRRGRARLGARRRTTRRGGVLRTELGDVEAEVPALLFLALLDELLLEQGAKDLGGALGAHEALFLLRGHRLKELLLRLGQLDARGLLGCGLLGAGLGGRLGVGLL